MAEKDAKYYTNLAASVAKKPTFDWPLVGILGMLKKFNPIAPASQWETGPGKFDTDPQNIYGLHDWLSTWNPKMLRMFETIEPWFNPAITYGAQKLGFEEDLKSRSEFMDRNVPYEKKGSFLDRQVTKIAEKLGGDPDVTYNQLAQLIPGVDAYGGEDRPDVISKFAEGVWAPSDEIKNLYSTLEDNVRKGIDQTDNYQAIFNNPLYRGGPLNPQILSLFRQVDPSLLEDIQDKAFIGGDEANKVHTIFMNNLSENQFPSMNLFFLDNNMANADEMNAVINHNVGMGGKNAEEINRILSQDGPIMSHYLRDIIYGTSRIALNKRGDEITDEAYTNLLNDSRMSILHSADAGDNLSGAFKSILESGNPTLQEDYLELSPSNKVGSSIFDMRELPMIIEDLEQLPFGLGEATTDLKEVLAHGVENPWITPPTEQAKGLDALFNEEHPTFNWKEGVSMEDYTDEEWKAGKEIWDTMDFNEREKYMKETHLPVDIAILSMAPGRRHLQKKAMKKIQDPVGIETVLDLALPQVSKDLSAFDYGRL